jgi:cytoskeletal protein CcmA (bactofilin family)
MSCLPEAALAEYADGELPPEEALQTEAHLVGCPSCRELVEALRGESRLLSGVLEWAPTGEGKPGVSWTDWVTTILLVFVAAAGVQALWSWLSAIGEQAPVGVVDKWSPIVSAVVDVLFFLAREGASMLTSLVTVVGVLVFLGGATVGLAFWRRRTSALCLLMALVALATSPVMALERRVGEQKGAVTIPAGETIDDSLFTAADTVYMDGVVTGNLLAFGRRVIVRGTVKGDLVACAQRVEVYGTVEGNVLSVSEAFTLRAPVGRSLHAFAIGHVGIDKEARIQGDALTFSREADLEGQVGRDLLAFAADVSLRSSVARNASAWTHRLRVEREATVGGGLTAYLDNKDELSIDPGATIGGKTETHLSQEGRPARGGSRYSHPGFYVWKMIWLCAAFLTGLVLQWLWPSLLAYRLGDATAVVKPVAIGFVTLVVVPVAAVVLGLTLVGLPLALLALCVWVAGLYLSGIVVGASVGRSLLVRRDAASPPFALTLIVGLLGVTLATSIPYLGGIARLLVISLGLGMSIVQARRAWMLPFPRVGSGEV